MEIKTKMMVTIAVTLLLLLMLPAVANDSPSREDAPVISGRVTTSGVGGIAGLAGVEMVFTSVGGESAVVITGADGSYSHEVNAGWSGNLTPQKLTYSFTPEAPFYEHVESHLPGQDFSAILSGPLVTISGSVFKQDGSALAGVVLQPFDGHLDFPGGAAVSDTEGRYSLRVGAGWSGLVRVSKDGFCFNTAPRSYGSLHDDMPGQDYRASAANLRISGRVTADNGTGIHGVTLTLTTDGVTQTALSDFNGNYRFDIPRNRSGTVTAVKAGWVFDPSSRLYNELQSHQPGQDYRVRVSEEVSPVISGIVTDDVGIGIAGVSLDFSNNGGSAVTDADGNYYHIVRMNWAGSVSLSKPGYRFASSPRDYEEVTHNRSGQNYPGTPVFPVISGRVASLYRESVAGARVCVEDSEGTAYVYTNRQGMYTYAVAPGWSGTFTPSKAAHYFSPASMHYTGVTANRERQDYTVAVIPPTISGFVTSLTSGGNKPLQGVRVTLSNGGGTTRTCRGGEFIRPLYYGWSGCLSLEKEGHVFLPFSQNYTDVTASLSSQNFIALPGRIDLILEVTREIAGSMIIKRHYARINISAAVEASDVPIPVYAYRISRKVDDGEYRDLRIVPHDELQTGGTFTFFDLDVEYDKTYVYKATAIQANGLMLKVSDEKKI